MTELEAAVIARAREARDAPAGAERAAALGRLGAAVTALDADTHATPRELAAAFFAELDAVRADPDPERLARVLAAGAARLSRIADRLNVPARTGPPPPP